MTIYAAQDRVFIVHIPGHDVESTREAAEELLSAKADFAPWAGYPATEVPDGVFERVEAAEANYEAMFTEVLTIEQAERILGRLKGAVYRAKVNARRFNKELP